MSISKNTAVLFVCQVVISASVYVIGAWLAPEISLRTDSKLEFVFVTTFCLALTGNITRNSEMI